MEDVAFFDEDLLDDTVPARLDHPRYLEAVDGIEDLGQRRLRQAATILEASSRSCQGVPPRLRESNFENLMKNFTVKTASVYHPIPFAPAVPRPV